MESILLASVLALATGQTFEVKPGFVIQKGERQDDCSSILKTVRVYRPTRFSQRVATTNGLPNLLVYRHDQDDHWVGSESLKNPNRLFPWAVPGGLHESTAWKSEVGYSLPKDGKIKVWSEIVPRARAPRYRWAFPDGTKFTDALYSKSGELFEIRVREKVDGKWKSTVPFRDLDKAPLGYKGPGKACVECHSKAGDSQQYGILIRGDDECFSLPILKEGTTTPDKSLPLEISQLIETQARRVDSTPTSVPSFAGAFVPSRQFSSQC